MNDLSDPAAGAGAQDTSAPRQQVLERLLADSRFVLATHENPDGDALGSLVAMHDLLTALGKDAEMFISANDLPLPFEYRFLQPQHVLEAPPQDIGQRTVIFLDCGNIDRNSAAVLRDGAHLVNIDHHHDNTCFGTVNHVVPDASCTAEIVWDLMHGLGVAPTGRVAEALYVALITDTGRFMYETTGPRAHEMAAELIGAGVDVQGIYRRLFEEVPLSKLRLLAKALAGLQSYDSGRLTLASLSAADFASATAEESDYEGIVDHLRAVRGTKVAALVREVPPVQNGDGASSNGATKRKVSLRATGEDVDVSAIARVKGGGGHRRAAGFSTELPLEEIVALLRREIATQLELEQGAPTPA
ncbi:MAG TPA: DHH family phosphoesterase [Solirubrobacteraceae bacterium]|jgi:phosphoesterase RecJ-like protein